MIDYLVERYDPSHTLHPEPGTEASALYHQWCWMSESTLIRPLGLRRVIREPANDPAQGLIDAATARFEEAMTMVETALDGNDFLVADRFSAADVMMGYSLGLLKDLLDGFSRARDYVDRLMAREAFRRIA